MTAPTLRDTTWNQVALASVGYTEARHHLRCMLLAGLCIGLTTHDLAQATGLPVEFITDLVREGTL